MEWYIQDGDDENITTTAIGKSMETNKPKQVELDSKLVADAAEPIVVRLIEALSLVLERMSQNLYPVFIIKLWLSVEHPSLEV